MHGKFEFGKGAASVADITVQNLTKYYGDKLILQDISFDIQPGEKVAILGANGAGKTTLLHILTGRLPYDGGHVAIGQGRTAGVIDQMPDFPPESTVEDILRLAFHESDEIIAAMDELTDEMTRRPDDDSLLRRYALLETRLDALGGYNRDYEIDRVCNGLEIPAEMRAQRFALLSGGEKTRINLARIILEQTDVLLLDEPTNHLDMDAVDWLGRYLEGYRGTVLIISHDRWFIDQCCDRVIEIHDCTCDFYSGNYSYYAVERERRREEQLKHHEHELAEKKRLEAVARIMHEHGTEHLAKRAASIEKRIARMTVTDRPKKDKKMTVTFGDPNYETEDVLKVRDITKSYDGREILHDISFQIRNRERVALLGANGAGKTTLLKLLLGEEQADTGVIRKGVGLKPAYLPQQVYFANPQRNLIDTLIYDKNVSMQVARNRLGSFQFTGEQQMKTVSMLSGGEKSRLRLCELMYDPLNLLILDEPTNHLDLASREWIEEAVEAFDGTLLFVSHDRYFVERFATRVLYLEDGRLIDFIGSYSAFLDWRAKGGGALPAAEPAPMPKKQKPAAPTLDDVPPPPAKLKRTGGTKNLQKQLNTLEREIAQLETQSAELEQQMIEASSDSARLLELMGEKETCDELLAAKMDEWEAVAAELEELQ
jgi:ATP-binding cassette subfamily F protein 3